MSESGYIVTRDLNVLNPEHGAHAGIGAYVLSAFNAFSEGHLGWSITLGEPMHDVMHVTLISPDGKPISMEELQRWDAALRRFGLKRTRTTP